MAEKKNTAGKGSLPGNGMYYQIISVGNGLAIEASETDDVFLKKPSRKICQQFQAVDAGNGFFQLINKQSKKALDIIWAGTQDGSFVHQWEPAGADNQLWSFYPAGKDICLIKAKSSGKCLDIAEMSAEEGAHLQIWEDVGGENQKWKLKEVKAAVKKVGTKKTEKHK